MQSLTGVGLSEGGLCGDAMSASWCVMMMETAASMSTSMGTGLSLMYTSVCNGEHLAS